MIGGYIKIDGIPQRAIVMDYHDGRALVRVMDSKPFTAYRRHGLYPCGIPSHIGTVDKIRLFGLRSTRISEGISFHDNTIAQKREEVLNGQKVGQI